MFHIFFVKEKFKSDLQDDPNEGNCFESLPCGKEVGNSFVTADIRNIYFMK